jgi:hypothetical protein
MTCSDHFWGQPSFKDFRRIVYPAAQDAIHTHNRFIAGPTETDPDRTAWPDAQMNPSSCQCSSKEPALCVALCRTQFSVSLLRLANISLC